MAATVTAAATQLLTPQIAFLTGAVAMVLARCVDIEEAYSRIDVRIYVMIAGVIPLGIVGAVLALWATGNSLSFVAIVGLIALAGIEVKNTILLVDFTNQLRAEGRTLDQAIREAGEMRFLPIVLTSLTAIGGLLPIAYSTNPLISPLAIVLIGGLISSTLLSRLVTPVVYKLIPPKV